VPSREFAEKRLQHATAAAEVARDRNQKAESVEKEGRKKFWVHEIKHDGFRLMVRRAALSAR
jgi:ATP-dependent DNA ligase